MLNNTKKIILFFSLLLAIASTNCQAQEQTSTPVVSCPATMSDGHSVYSFYTASLYDSPVWNGIELVPDIDNKDRLRWTLNPTINPYFVCSYTEGHSIVFHIKQASYCEVINTPKQARCMP